MPTIRELRELKPNEFLLDSYITRAREIETIREAAKLDWEADAATESHSHLWGALGELLIADVLGTDIDDAAKYGDGGVDGTFRGRTYDVKLSSFAKDPYLKIFTANKHWSDIYILVVVEKDALTGEIVGWATKEEVRRGKVKDFGRGPNHILGRRDLHPLSELLVLNEMD